MTQPLLTLDELVGGFRVQIETLACYPAADVAGRERLVSDLRDALSDHRREPIQAHELVARTVLAGVLTPREREVAALVAGGLTNRLVAEKLGVSQRTAESHLENILHKLGLVNRTEVAAWVAGTQLAPEQYRHGDPGE